MFNVGRPEFLLLVSGASSFLGLAISRLSANLPRDLPHLLSAPQLMKLPADSVIDPRKITDYLLLRREVDDKSGFLRLAGYESCHATRLMEDIRALLLLDACSVEVSEYAEKFAIDADLTGPNGRRLHVRSIWARLHASGETRFVTLYPSAS